MKKLNENLMKLINMKKNEINSMKEVGLEELEDLNLEVAVDGEEEVEAEVEEPVTEIKEDPKEEKQKEDNKVEAVEDLNNFKEVVEERCDNNNVTIDCSIDDREQVTFEPCEDNKDITLLGPDRDGIVIKCQARLLNLRVRLKNVCKGRKIALGVLLCEFDSEGILRPRGLRSALIEVPNDGNTPKCTNVNVNELCFVLPDNNICHKRRVFVKVIAHYADLNPRNFCL
ncbi:hypothetical protein [Thermohalobacter berrensis]|uniref:Uncharacterized protein n=1 Tax=Thermohalobacter berrensis TaxID=99594 RepID=A0A419SZB8_9FIRM|nr:hypothetical protein [Thermohalobacter berrensis]RKD30541.1 hypothetical protein BET03_04170 [Thermohalobacter berrensis]